MNKEFYEAEGSSGFVPIKDVVMYASSKEPAQIVKGVINTICGELDVCVKNVYSFEKPKKPLIPRFLEEWFSKNPLNGWWKKIAQWEQEVPLEDKEVYEWYSNYNETKFMQAWIAYPNVEVEKEKLYVVEIAEAILTKITRGNNVQYKFLNFADVSDVFEKTTYTTRLTEREIKQKDERLWQFAKEVDDDTR